MNKSRLEAFTDAMVAIAATLMALEIRPPKVNTLSSLMEEAPVFFAYIISFILIYFAWYSHHNTFKNAKNITKIAFLENGVWLFFLTLVPFVTNWIGESPDSGLAELTYVIVQFLWVVSYNVLNYQIQKDNPDMPAALPRSRYWLLIFVLGFLFAAIGTAFIPQLGLIITGLVTIVSFVQLARV